VDAPVGCVSDNMGREFAVAFINNLAGNGSFQLELYPTSFSRRPSVDVSVRRAAAAAGGWSESLTVESGRSAMVDVPSELELRGTELSRKAVLVTVDDDDEGDEGEGEIGVYAMSSAARGSCDGLVALPVSSLGVDHFALCFFPPDHQSQIGVVAVHPATTVTVTLRRQTRPGVRVEWNQTMYGGGDSFTIDMDQYDTVQLQSLRCALPHRFYPRPACWPAKLRPSSIANKHGRR